MPSSMPPDVPHPPSLKPETVPLPPGLINTLRDGGPDVGTRLDAILASHPFDVAMIDQKGHSLLHLALDLMPQSPQGWFDPSVVYPTIGWLLEHGAPADAVSAFGATALSSAAHRATVYPGTLRALEQAVLKITVAREQDTLRAAMNSNTGLEDRARQRL